MDYLNDIVEVTKLCLPWYKLDGSNILITGATGLIGSTLAEVLLSRENHNYHVYCGGRDEDRAKKLFYRFRSLPTYHFIQFDVTKPLVSNIRFQFIIHCASGAAPVDFIKYPVEVMKANILGVDHLLDYGKDHGLKRFLYLSSGEVYGEGDGRVFTEDYSGYVNCVLPRSCYPSSKRAAESLCVSYAAEYDLDIVIARPCHVFGPNFTERDNRVCVQFIRNVLRGEDILLKSSGTQYRSWCYVVDCASALLYLLLLGINGEAYNIADPSSTVTIKELASIIASIYGLRVIVEDKQDTEKKGYNPVTKSCFSITKLQRLGWKTCDSLDNNIKKTINYKSTDFI